MRSSLWTRAPRMLSTIAVSGIAGYASYWHQVAVALMAGERREIAHVIPLSVDGMLIVAATFMAEDRAEGRKPRLWAVLGFWTGTLASVSANVAGAQPSAIGYVVAAWPAVALLLVVEMWSRKGKLIPTEAAATMEPATPAQQIEEAPTPASQAVAPGPRSGKRRPRQPRYLPVAEQS